MKVILIKLGIFLFSLVFIAAGAAAILKFMEDDTQTKVALIAFVLVWIILTLVLLTIKIGPSEAGSADEKPAASARKSWVSTNTSGFLMPIVLIVMAFLGMSYMEAFVAMAITAGGVLLAGAWSRDPTGKGSDSK